MKKLLTLLLTLVLAASLVACGGNQDTSNNGTTISIWHTFTEGQEALLNTLADEFEAANEGITIEVINTGAANEFQGKVTDSVSNGVGPNLIFDYASFAKSFDIEGANFLLSFEDYWDFDYKSLLSSEGLYAEGTNFSDGKLHVAPIYTAGALLFCNKTIFDAAGVALPTTWDEMKTASKAIYEKTGVVGLSLDSPTDFAQLLIYQCNGGQIVDMEKNEVAFNNETVQSWLEWWAEGVKEGYFQVQAQAADGYNSSDINNGLIASYIGSSAGIPYLNFGGKQFTTEEGVKDTIYTTSELLNGQTADLQVVRVPMMSTADIENAGIIWTRGAIGFNTGDEAENQATADFVKFFIDNNFRWVEELNANTPYKAVEEMAEYQTLITSDKALNALNAQVPYSFVAPVFTGVTEMRTELTALIKGTASADFDAKAALQTCADNVNAAMKQ